MWLESTGFVWEGRLTTFRRTMAAAVLALAWAGSAAAQRPDLNGVWQGPYVPDMTRTGRNQTGEANLPFTAAGEKEWKSYDAANGDYTGTCLPFGLSRSVNAPNPFQIVQNDGYVAFLFEVNNWFHVVPLTAAARRRIPTRSGSATPSGGGTATHWSSRHAGST